VVRVGTPTQTSKGLEDRERGREERAGKQEEKERKAKRESWLDREVQKETTRQAAG